MGPENNTYFKGNVSSGLKYVDMVGNVYACVYATPTQAVLRTAGSLFLFERINDEYWADELDNSFFIAEERHA